jgi:hypothetical protein
VVPLAGFPILELLFKSLPEYCLVKSQETSELLLRGSVGPDCLYTFPSVSLHSLEQFQIPIMPFNIVLKLLIILYCSFTSFNTKN